MIVAAALTGCLAVCAPPASAQSADEIADKSVAALGGRAALERQPEPGGDARLQQLPAIDHFCCGVDGTAAAAA